KAKPSVVKCLLNEGRPEAFMLRRARWWSSSLLPVYLYSAHLLQFPRHPDPASGRGEGSVFAGIGRKLVQCEGHLQCLPGVDLVGPVGRNEDGHRSADHLIRTIAKEPLGTPVPAGDDPVEILTDDGVVGGMHDRSKPLTVFVKTLPIAQI